MFPLMKRLTAKRYGVGCDKMHLTHVLEMISVPYS